MAPAAKHSALHKDHPSEYKTDAEDQIEEEEEDDRTASARRGSVSSSSANLQVRIAIAATIFLGISVLISVITAEALREMDFGSGWRSRSLILVGVVGLALTCVAVAGPLTHGVIGINRHRSRGYAFFQPFAGGWRFVALQIFGWTLYAITVASFLYMIYMIVRRVPVFTGAIASAGFGGITSQICLFLSLRYFEKSQGDELDATLKNVIAFVTTAIIYSIPMLFFSGLCLFAFALPLSISVPLAIPCLYYYSQTYRNSPQHTGARIWPRFRDSTLWHHLEHYFSLQVVAETPLDPKGVYMMGYHPHGMLYRSGAI